MWAFCVNGGGRSGLFVSILNNCVDAQLLNVCGRVFNDAVCSVFVIHSLVVWWRSFCCIFCEE